MMQPVRFRYAGFTRQWKGNLHVHSSRSDGGRTPAELAALYAAAGYDFIVLTDHWVPGVPDDLPHPCPLTVLDGVELDGPDATGASFHVICIGCCNGVDRSMSLEAAMDVARRQGAMLLLAHPLWTGNSTEDALRHGFDGVEAFNNISDWLNGKSSGAFHWDRMLDGNPGVVGPAVDDAHITDEHPPWNGGWIHVDAPAPTPAALMASLKAGRFVSSRGPVIHALAAEGREIRVECSPVTAVRLVGPANLGKRLTACRGSSLTSGVFTVPDEWPHARLEIEDACGRRAWTNALFT